MSRSTPPAAGLRTALVEKEDFASGTSSKSSKMVHGGLRYLQQREFRLVYENLAERQRLLDNAPHLVRPLPFLIPLFGRDGVVAKTVARSYATALWMYDLTGGWRIGQRHREVDKADALAHLPTLDTDHLVAGFLYYDARTDDARLTLTIARTAALEYGAAVANYTDGRSPHHRRGRPRQWCGGAPGTRRRVGRFRGTGPDRRQCDGGLVGRRRARSTRASHPHSIRPAKGVHVTRAGRADAL